MVKAPIADWTVTVPVASALLLGAAPYLPLNPVLTLACVAALMDVVIAAVRHAEVVAHRVGEPFGTPVLALAVTVIEVALIVSMMLAAGAEKAALARDSVYTAVMLICTGVVGVSVLAGALRHRESSASEGSRIRGQCQGAAPGAQGARGRSQELDGRHEDGRAAHFHP